MLLWLFDPSCVDQSYEQFQILASNSTQYMNVILLYIVHLSCVDQSYNDFQIFASNSAQYLKMNWFVLFFRRVLVDHVNSSIALISKSTKRLNRILRLMIHFTCVCWSSNHLESFALKLRKCMNRIKTYDLFICRVFTDE